MKTIFLVLPLVFASVVICPGQTQAQGTAFTYQGQLRDGVNVADGKFDFKFRIWTSASGPAQVGVIVTNAGVEVRNGMFSATIDFGAGVFDGGPRWLEIGVRTNREGVFTLLSPRQALTPIPYAIFAGGVPAAGISGTIGSNQIGSGAITSDMLAPGAAEASIRASGQGTVPGGTILLSTDPNATNLTASGYLRLGGQVDLSWQQRRSDTPRSGHTAVWTGRKMILWGGGSQAGGCYYDPVDNMWSTIALKDSPSINVGHTAIYTGRKMIVWGGGGYIDHVDAAGCYDITTDSWSISTTSNAPVSRTLHTAVWTGSEMVIWGGQTYHFPVLTAFGDGARYDPSNDTWSKISTNGAPSGRFSHTAVWTGTEMIIWGGSFWNGSEVAPLNDGACYNPRTDTWRTLSTNGAPVPRSSHTAIWTGSEMIVWGSGGGVVSSNGARYNPSNDTWSSTSLSGSPKGMADHVAVWTGTEMIIWGGSWNKAIMQFGASYNPINDRWSQLSTIGAPSARGNFTAVWTGGEMVLFGGWSGGNEVLVADTTYSYTPSRVFFLYSRP